MERGGLKESSRAPPRSETAHPDTQRNLILRLHCIQPNDLSPEIPEELLVVNGEECFANVAVSVFMCAH